MWLTFQRVEGKKHSTLDALKGEKQQISYKEGTQKLKSKMQSPSKVFRTQNERKSACMMNLYVKSCQVKCG